MQTMGNITWTMVFLALYILSTTVFFGSVPWSKFSHMFFKPAAAFQKRVEEAIAETGLNREEISLKWLLDFEASYCSPDDEIVRLTAANAGAITGQEIVARRPLDPFVRRVNALSGAASDNILIAVSCESCH